MQFDVYYEIIDKHWGSRAITGGHNWWTIERSIYDLNKEAYPSYRYYVFPRVKYAAQY